MSILKLLLTAARLVAILGMCSVFALRVEAQTIESPTKWAWRIEVLPVQSKTLSSREFLNGESTGHDVALGGELSLPFAMLRGKVPAVIMVHGSAGMGASNDYWTRALNEAGIAVFNLDSFSGRNIVSTIEDQTQLDHIAMMVDAYRALDVLAAHRAIRSDKIAVMGFSKGAVAAVFSSSTRFKTAYGGANTFAAHIGMYTPCNYRFNQDTKTSNAPIRLFHGITDDYVSIAACRELVADLKANGADVLLTEYPDTNHGFDNPALPPIYELKKATSSRNCRLTERADGVMLNAATMLPYDMKADTCIETGTHVGYNPQSTAAARDAVVAFLKQVFAK